MELELKHLAPYLPYGLRYFVDFTDGKSWLTFFCNKCGGQVMPKAKKCESTNAFFRGCGTELNWNELTNKPT